MRVSKECLVKAIKEGFKVRLEVDGEFAGLIAEKSNRVLICVSNGIFMAVEEVLERGISVRNININRQKKVMTVRG